MTMEEITALMNLTFPYDIGLQNQIRAALLHLLSKGSNFEEMPITLLGLADENGTFQIHAHVTIEGKDRYIREPVPLLVGLGYADVLLMLSKTGLRRRARFNGVKINRTQGSPSWAALEREVKQAVDAWNSLR